MQKGLFGTRTQTPQEQEQLQKERELRKRKAMFQQLRNDYDQQWATLDALAQLAREVATLSTETLTPTDLPYPADYPRIIELVQTITARVTDYQTTLALPEDLHPTKADSKKLSARTRQLSEAIGALQHLFWTVKSKLKYRTVMADGRLCVIQNEAPPVRTIVQYIEDASI